MIYLHFWAFYPKEKRDKSSKIGDHENDDNNNDDDNGYVDEHDAGARATKRGNEGQEEIRRPGNDTIHTFLYLISYTTASYK